MSMKNISNIHHSSICGNSYLNPVDPAMCALPGIGLHLNTVASNSSNMPLTIDPPLLPEQTSPATIISGSDVCTPVDDHSSKKTTRNIDVYGQEIHKKKRLVNMPLTLSLPRMFTQ